MAFGGVLAPFTPGSAGAASATGSVTGGTLTQRVSTPLAANGDTGVLTTGTPGANQNQFPANFAKGAGNWVASDLNHVGVSVADAWQGPTGLAGAKSDVYVATTAIVGGNLVITIHNRGAVASGTLTVAATYA